MNPSLLTIDSNPISLVVSVQAHSWNEYSIELFSYFLIIFVDLIKGSDCKRGCISDFWPAVFKSFWNHLCEFVIHSVNYFIIFDLHLNIKNRFYYFEWNISNKPVYIWWGLLQELYNIFKIWLENFFWCTFNDRLKWFQTWFKRSPSFILRHQNLLILRKLNWCINSIFSFSI